MIKHILPFVLLITGLPCFAQKTSETQLVQARIEKIRDSFALAAPATARAAAYGIRNDGSDKTAAINKVLALTNVTDLIFDEANSGILVNGTVRVPDGKKLIFLNGALLTGKGAVNGGIVECDFKRQCFDTTLQVTNLQNGLLSVCWFGAAADFHFNGVPAGRDNYTSFMKAISAGRDGSNFQSTLYKTRIIIPAGPQNYFYRIGRTIEIYVGIELFGEGIESTTLYFPPGVKGLWFQYGKHQAISRNCYVHDLKLTGNVGHAQESAGYYDARSHGIEVNSSYNRFENVKVQFFNGDGFHVFGNTSPSIADLNSFINCQSASNSGSGMMLRGADANVNVVEGGTYEGNAIWGICDSSFLGNNIKDIHTSANGFHTKGRSLVHRNGVGYMAIKPSVGIDPASSKEYWRETGRGSVSTFYPDWDKKTNYNLSGAIYLYNVNSLGQYSGIYSEGGQYEGRNDGNGLVVGGFLARFIEGGPTISTLAGIVSVKDRLKVGNFGTHDFISFSRDRINWENGKTGASYSLVTDVGSGVIALAKNGNTGDLYFFSNDLQPSNWIGKNAWPDIYNIGSRAFFFKRYDVGGYRGVYMSEKVPMGGVWSDGEIVLKTGAGDTIGWRRTSGSWYPLIANTKSSPPKTIDWNATITIDASAASIHRLTLRGRTTIATPVNASDGQELTIDLTQDASGSRTVNWSNAFRWSKDRPLAQISKSAGHKDKFKFQFDASVGKWDIVDYTLGIY